MNKIIITSIIVISYCTILQAQSFDEKFNTVIETMRLDRRTFKQFLFYGRMYTYDKYDVLPNSNLYFKAITLNYNIGEAFARFMPYHSIDSIPIILSSIYDSIIFNSSQVEIITTELEAKRYYSYTLANSIDDLWNTKNRKLRRAYKRLVSNREFYLYNTNDSYFSIKDLEWYFEQYLNTGIIRPQVH